MKLVYPKCVCPNRQSKGVTPMFHECRHIKASGSKCHAAALSEKPYCYYHHRAHQSIGRAAAPSAPYEQKELEMPFLEDRGAVQIALSEVVSAIANHRIDLKRAGLLIYALQVASSNAKNPQDLIATQQVRERSENEAGDELAPEITTYEKEDPEYVPADDELTLRDLLLREVRRLHAQGRTTPLMQLPAEDDTETEREDL
jgi:hypothetical protein